MAPKSKKPTSTDRREAARLEAERLRNRAKQAERKQRMIIGVIALVVVALIAVAGVIIWQQSQRTLLTDFEGATPAASDENGGIAVGETGSGQGAVEVQVYLDFSCPYCGTFEQLHGQDLQELSDAGDAELIYHPVNFLASPQDDYSTRAANAFAVVATESPEHVLDFAEALFAQEPGMPDEQIAATAIEVGVPQEVADTFAEGTYAEWVDVASDQAQRDGHGGTPSVTVDGETVPNEDFSEPGAMAAIIAEEAN